MSTFLLYWWARTGPSTPHAASPILSRGEGCPLLTSWQYFTWFSQEYHQPSCGCNREYHQTSLWHKHIADSFKWMPIRTPRSLSSELLSSWVHPARARAWNCYSKVHHSAKFNNDKSSNNSFIWVLIGMDHPRDTFLEEFTYPEPV